MFRCYRSEVERILNWSMRYSSSENGDLDNLSWHPRSYFVNLLSSVEESIRYHLATVRPINFLFPSAACWQQFVQLIYIPFLFQHEDKSEHRRHIWLDPWHEIYVTVGVGKCNLFFLVYNDKHFPYIVSNIWCQIIEQFKPKILFLLQFLKDLAALSCVLCSFFVICYWKFSSYRSWYVFGMIR